MYKIKSLPTAVCVCDRCGRVIPLNDSVEDRERLSIDFEAGHGSVFGDGNTVHLDLCQHCFKKALGRWLRVTPRSEDVSPLPSGPHLPMDSALHKFHALLADEYGTHGVTSLQPKLSAQYQEANHE